LKSRQGTSGKALLAIASAGHGQFQGISKTKPIKVRGETSLTFWQSGPAICV
jgi:hypothetical protein